jgi:phosphoribosylaminoimidazolecarboxamide formyltransferase / IMP cyclohydrolase
MRIKHAVLSVWNKEGIAEFAKQLSVSGCRVSSSGGTSSYLQKQGILVQEINTLTGFPEILDGRVKTLHPAVHGGILARRDRSDDMETLQRHKITPIDLVAVNLYPFEMMLERQRNDSELSDKELEEFIDIGGPTLLRAAAKNYRDVIVLCDPLDYTKVIKELNREGDLGLSLRRSLAEKVFSLTAAYDDLISRWLLVEN